MKNIKSIKKWALWLSPTIAAAAIVACSSKNIHKEDISVSSTVNEKSKIGFWNVLNDGGKQSYKNEGLAKVIKHIGTDIMGLAEIDDPMAVSNLTKQLSPAWKFIVSKNKASGLGGAGQAEYYAFIYNSNKYEPVKFKKTDSIGAIYQNPSLPNELVPGTKTNFVRPPFGVEFKYIKTNHNFTFLISHNDSPGASGQKGSIIEKSKDGQGTQELWEAKHMKDVAKWFDDQDGNNNDLVYMGDTNIKTNHGDKPFTTLLQNGFVSMLNPSTSVTSLGSSINDYANAYDKIFTNSPYIIKNKKDSGFYPLYNVFKDKVLNETRWEDKVNQERIDTHKKPYKNNIRSGISDHSPIFTELDFSIADKDGGSVAGAKAPTRLHQKYASKSTVDVNAGDLSNLTAVHGVGESTSKAIRKYRTLVGQITNKITLDKIIQFSNSRLTLEKITTLKPSLKFDFSSPVIKDSRFTKTDLNSASYIELKTKLKLSSLVAKRLIAYRSNTHALTQHVIKQIITKPSNGIIWFASFGSTPNIDPQFKTKHNVNKLNAKDISSYGFSYEDSKYISDSLTKFATTHAGNGIASWGDLNSVITNNTILLNIAKKQLPFFTKIDSQDLVRVKRKVVKVYINSVATQAKDLSDFITRLISSGAQTGRGSSGIGNLSKTMLKNIYSYLKSHPKNITIAALVKEPINKGKSYSSSSQKKIMHDLASVAFA